MAKAGKSDELRGAFEDHLEVTKGQITRLEQVSKSWGFRSGESIAPRWKA